MKTMKQTIFAGLAVGGTKGGSPALVDIRRRVKSRQIVDERV